MLEEDILSNFQAITEEFGIALYHDVVDYDGDKVLELEWLITDTLQLCIDVDLVPELDKTAMFLVSLEKGTNNVTDVHYSIRYKRLEEILLAFRSMVVLYNYLPKSNPKVVMNIGKASNLNIGDVVINDQVGVKYEI